MAKKKVTEPKVSGDVGYYRTGYWTHMEYFATGEGVTHEIQFCYADNPQEAIEKHLDRFVGKENQDARKYFGVGVTAYEYKSADAKKLLKAYLKNGEKLFNVFQEAGCEMYMKIYWNFS